jgi:hypothetical protein
MLTGIKVVLSWIGNKMFDTTYIPSSGIAGMESRFSGMENSATAGST